jgi:hypothetical protein
MNNYFCIIYFQDLLCVSTTEGGFLFCHWAVLQNWEMFMQTFKGLNGQGFLSTLSMMTDTNSGHPKIETFTVLK